MNNARTRIKICGITRLTDAQAAIRAGVDALGFVFYPPSKRSISISSATRVCDKLSPFIDKVGLFVNPSEDEVKRTVDNIPLSLLQFHGDETPEFCDKFSLPYIKSIPMVADNDDNSYNNEIIEKFTHLHSNAIGFLLDTFHKDLAGGTGIAFDWEGIRNLSEKPIILAGGLNKKNIYKAIRCVSPYAVDISSGVESAPGVKDSEKILEFVQSVRSADNV